MCPMWLNFWLTAFNSRGRGTCVLHAFDLFAPLIEVAIQHLEPQPPVASHVKGHDSGSPRHVRQGSSPSASACRITSASTSSEPLVSVRVLTIVPAWERDSLPARNGNGLRPSRSNRSS